MQGCHRCRGVVVEQRHSLVLLMTMQLRTTNMHFLLLWAASLCRAAEVEQLYVHNPQPTIHTLTLCPATAHSAIGLLRWRCATPQFLPTTQLHHPPPSLNTHVFPLAQHVCPSSASHPCACSGLLRGSSSTSTTHYPHTDTKSMLLISPLHMHRAAEVETRYAQVLTQLDGLKQQLRQREAAAEQQQQAAAEGGGEDEVLSKLEAGVGSYQVRTGPVS